MVSLPIYFQEGIQKPQQLSKRWSLGLEYQIIEEIGHGAYARVFKAIETKTGKKVAIKKFNRALASKRLAQYCLREVEIIMCASHSGIVRMHRMLRSKKSIFLVLDYMPQDLRKFIRSPEFLDHEQIKSVMYDLFIGLNYLHSAKIVHRDIKPGNILIDKHRKIKICDFGLARSYSGLKVCDFDDIYRKEFSNSTERLATLTNLESSLESDEKIEDLDEHVQVNRIIRTLSPTRYCRDSVQPTAMHPVSPPTTQATKKGRGVFRPASEDPVSELIGGGKEERKSILVTKATVFERRIEYAKSIKPKPLDERELTSHVASRWYRAPEVILLEKAYCTAVDVWGAGCIFGELLQMLKGNQENYQKRKPLFPGDSCFPLSPKQRPDSKEEVHGFVLGDQLIMILTILGSQSEDDTSFIGDFGAKQYMKMMPERKRMKFQDLFPGATEDEIDLLTRMLAFNPIYRITAKEALRHEYFASVRNKEKEIETDSLQFVFSPPDCDCISALISMCERK